MGGDGNDRDEFTDLPPVFADLDHDNLPEIILFSGHELAGEYVNRRNSLWAVNPDMTSEEGKTPDRSVILHRKIYRTHKHINSIILT